MFDKVIKNVRIIDGSAAPWYRGDIGIQDGRIRKIGCIAQEENTVDGGDLYAEMCIRDRWGAVLIDYGSNTLVAGHNTLDGI